MGTKADEYFFNVFLCSFCRDKRSFESCKFCSGCKLVSYCSVEHQKAHWKSHKPLCKVAQDLCRARQIDSIFALPLRNFLLHPQKETPKHEIAWKKQLLKYIFEQRLRRKLRIHESEAINFPKNCAVCFKTDILKATVCRKCFGVAYCSKLHQSLDKHEVCSEFELALNTGLLQVSTPMFEPRMIPDLAVFLALNMKSFITEDPLSALFFQSKFNDRNILTDILTFTYAISQIPNFELGESLVVHLVAICHHSNILVQLWENVLHIFPTLKTVTIFHINPHADFSSSVLTELKTICQYCQAAKKSLNFASYKGRYDEYCESSSFQRPNVIVALNYGLYDIVLKDHKWRDTLPYFFQFDGVPLIITAICERESKHSLERMLSVVGGEMINIVTKCEKNPYAALVPIKSWQNIEEAVLYSNNYLTILTPK